MGAAQIRQLLSLYKQVWRVQRTLPTDMQSLANTFIRHEFREHYDRADEAQLSEFLQAWRVYVNGAISEVPMDTLQSPKEFTSEQLKRMESLERTIKTD